MFWNRLWAEVAKYLAPERLVGYCGKLLQIVVIVGIAALLAWAVGRILKRSLGSRTGLTSKSGMRTVLTILQSAVFYVFFFIALVMVLRVLGVDFTALIAGAGVVGLAIGFGAQTLVRDFLAGFFLLFEDSVNVGDFVTLGDISGTVEFIGVRRTQLRAFDGTLYTIPNGELTKFGNSNRGYMQAVVTVDLAYEQDSEIGMSVAAEAASQWYADNREVALAEPVVQGLLDFGESGLSIRVVARVKPMRHWEVERDLRSRLKRAFDSRGVEVPFPRRVLYQRTESDQQHTTD